MTDWQKQRSERSARLNAGSHYASGKMVPPDKAKAFLEAVIRPGDRVCLEGDNQKQADFLAEALADVDRSRIQAGRHEERVSSHFDFTRPPRKRDCTCASLGYDPVGRQSNGSQELPRCAAQPGS